METSPDGGDLPDSGDETLDKMACIEAMLHRMEQSPSASDALLERLLALVSQEDLQKMVQLQTHMLSRFEKTNEMLLNFNALSMARYESSCQEFRRHTQLLVQLKTDLDSVYRRIRVLKTTLSKLYPESFQVCSVKHQLTEEEEEEESGGTKSSTSDSSTRPKTCGGTPSQHPVQPSQSSQVASCGSQHGSAANGEKSNDDDDKSNRAEIINGED